MIYFLVKFILTNIIFSSIIAGALLFFFRKYRAQSKLEVYIYSLGLGPSFTALMLFWLITIFPHKSNSFYLSVILIIYTGIAVLLLSFLIRAWKNLDKPVIQIFNLINNRIQFIKQKGLYFLFLLIVVIVIWPKFARYIENYLVRPLYGHDVLAYGTMGKIYFNEKSLSYNYTGVYSKTGFSNFGKHAPGFPLLATWERILNHYLRTDSDYYFKSISPYYGFLIILTAFYWFRKRSIILALLGLTALFSGFSFFLNFCTYHIDMYRIYFLSLSWIFLAYAVERKDIFSLFILGVFSGLSAFSHSIGAIISGFNCISLLLFMDAKIIVKIKSFLSVCIIIIIFGGFHYIFDIFWGRGWIL